MKINVRHHKTFLIQIVSLNIYNFSRMTCDLGNLNNFSQIINGCIHVDVLQV